MKIEILKKDFEEALVGAAKAVGKNLTLPLLSNIYIKAEKNKLTIRATNLTIGVEYYLPVKCDEGFEVALPTQTLLQSIHALSSDKLTLSYTNGNVAIETKERKLLIKGVPSEEFPTIPKVVGTSYAISIKHFIDGLKSVFFSAAQSDIKPEIASVYIYPNNTGLVFVATDSFRLAEKKVSLKGVQNFSPILLPTKHVADIIRILEDDGGDIEILVNKNQIAFSGRSFYLTSRLVDGVYPDYQQIIPKDHTTSITMLKSDLIDALRVSSVFSDKFGHMTLSVDPKHRSCVVATVSDIGENKSDIQAALDGDAQEVHLNIRYLTEALSVVNDDSVSLAILNPNKPVVLTSVGNQSFLYLIMPMNR